MINTRNVRKHIAPISLALLFGSILFSVAGLHGFLDRHLGFAGPDLFASAINLRETKYFLARGIYDDGTYNLYNHHPPLGFLLFSAIASLKLGYADQLMVAYALSATFTILGWAVIYRVFLLAGFTNESAAFGVVVTACCTLFVTYRAIINFDCLSILGSGLLFHALMLLDKAKQRIDRLTLSRLLLVFASLFLVSWYSVPIVFGSLGLLWLIKGAKSDIGRQILGVAACLLLYLLLLISIMVLTEAYQAGGWEGFLDFLRANASINAPPAERAVNHALLIERLLGQFRELLPRPVIGWVVLLGLLAVFVIRKLGCGFFRPRQEPREISGSSNYLSPVVPLLMTMGVMAFVTGTLYWSSIHPFALLYLTAPLAYLYASLYRRVFSPYPTVQLCLLILLSLSAIYLYGHQRNKDLKHAQNMQALLTLVDNEFQTGYSFNWLREGCNVFNPGALIYIASSPNKWRPAVSAFPLERQVLVECLDQEVGIMRFSTVDGARSYLIKNGHQGYQNEYSERHENKK